MSAPKPPDVLSEVSDFIARYLWCSEHQRTVLALWVLHTYCYRAAEITPYLSIQSRHKQAGKTLCLRVLAIVCEETALTSHLTASDMIVRMQADPASSFLLDQCHATFGTRTRNKAPNLRTLLTGSVHWDIGYSYGLDERHPYCPKAFAGKGDLPEDIADYSIPILLEPLKLHNGPQPKNNLDNVLPCSLSPTCSLPKERFSASRADLQAEPLRRRLSAWAKQHCPILENLPSYSYADFPPSLSPRQQDICEPLLQLAHTVGGPWPARFGEALLSIFTQQAAFEFEPRRQLLAAIRDCFAHYGYPQLLRTSTLTAWLDSLLDRPWEADGRFSARCLAGLLGAFHIHPRHHRLKNPENITGPHSSGCSAPAFPTRAAFARGGVAARDAFVADGVDVPWSTSDRFARGYELQAFIQPWKEHLGFELFQLQETVETTDHESEINNENAVCDAVTDDRMCQPEPAHEPMAQPGAQHAAVFRVMASRQSIKKQKPKSKNPKAAGQRETETSEIRNHQ